MKKKKCSPPYPPLHIEESLYLLLSGSIWCILIKMYVKFMQGSKLEWSPTDPLLYIGMECHNALFYTIKVWKFQSEISIRQNCCLIVIMFTLLGHCCRMLVCSCIKKMDWAQEPLTACSSLWRFNMLKDTIYYKVDMPHKYLCGKGHANHFKASVLPTSLSHNTGVEK